MIAMCHAPFDEVEAVSEAGWSGHLHGTWLIAQGVSRHVANICADVARCAVSSHAAGVAGRTADPEGREKKPERLRDRVRELASASLPSLGLTEFTGATEQRIGALVTQTVRWGETRAAACRPDEKSAIGRLARAAGLDVSSYVLARALPAAQDRFDGLLRALAAPHGRSYVLAELNDFLSVLSGPELADAVGLTSPPFSSCRTCACSSRARSTCWP
jgi:hypothetical protein